MHLFFMVRGIISQVKLFEIFMQSQMFIWKRKNLKTGEDELCQVQGSLRVMPFGYEYVFPEESLDEVLTMLDVEAEAGSCYMPKFKKWIIRHALGDNGTGHKVMPIPKYKKVPTNRYIEKRGLAIYFIGIKKDHREKAKDWGYEQEML